MTSDRRPLRRILYAAMRYDYGRPAQGTSFEYNNFYRTLVRMVPSVVEFDFMSILQREGKAEMNRKLVAAAMEKQPDLIFFVLFTDEFEKDALRTLSRDFVTFNWFCDDHWRFASFSRHYAPCFRFVSTTDPAAVDRYASVGFRHALLTQWGCNHFDYVKMPGVRRDLPVSFVGQPHGNRRGVVQRLRQQGIDVATFGQGWEGGRVSQEEMIRTFNRSKINLNLSNSSWNIHTIFRRQQQIKGRNFEIPGCGGFLLTNHVQGIERYYRIGEEIVCFEGRRDLTDKIRYYLAHDEERERVAEQGYRRTLSEHTYVRRLTDLFDAMGFVL